MFEETESFGPEVAEVIAQRVNDACSKKAMDSKLKDLYEKYKTPANCKYLCVPKVNLESWHDLSKESKSKDLGLQELQKGIVKASWPIIQLFHSALKLVKTSLQWIPMLCYLYWQRLLPFSGMPHFLRLLNEENFLNQISLSLFSLLVTSLTPLQLVCLRMNYPSILRRSERSIRYLGRCLAVRLQERTWSVLTREGLMHPAGAHRSLEESSLF